MLANGIARPSGLAAAPRRVGRGGAGFSLPGGEAASAPEVAEAAPLFCALGLQEEAPRRPPPSRQKSVAQAETALQDLRGFQLALLSDKPAGRDAMEAAAAIPQAADPALEAILAGIRLRARIELARGAAGLPVTSLKSTVDQSFGASIPASDPLGTGRAAR